MPFPCSAAAGFLLWSYLPFFIGKAATGYFGAGFMGGFFYYTVLHHCEHAVRIKSVWFESMRRRWIAHAVHHGRADKNYGVTTALWDRVFGTYAPAHSRALRDSL
jgi:sterol desaturase/sphingolipid hydroxylase (fatty acid hydroxylase superfamily)